MRYNKALDMIAAAILHFQNNKPLTASKMFAEAAADPSIRIALASIEKANAAGFRAMAGEDDGDEGSDNLDFLNASDDGDEDDGEDLDLEADFAEDDEDGGELDLEADVEGGEGGWPFTASDDEDEDDEGGDSDEDEDEGEEEAGVRARKIAQARFSRAMVNLQAAAKKKAPAKKKPAFPGAKKPFAKKK